MNGLDNTGKLLMASSSCKWIRHYKLILCYALYATRCIPLVRVCQVYVKYKLCITRLILLHLMGQKYFTPKHLLAVSQSFRVSVSSLFSCLTHNFTVLVQFCTHSFVFSYSRCHFQRETNCTLPADIVRVWLVNNYQLKSQIFL